MFDQNISALINVWLVTGTIPHLPLFPLLFVRGLVKSLRSVSSMVGYFFDSFIGLRNKFVEFLYIIQKFISHHRIHNINEVTSGVDLIYLFYLRLFFLRIFSAIISRPIPTPSRCIRATQSNSSSRSTIFA